MKVPYDENSLKHNESPLAISEWQEFNDVMGADSIHWEKILQRIENEEVC
jgi:hypothetical protein